MVLYPLSPLSYRINLLRAGEFVTTHRSRDFLHLYPHTICKIENRFCQTQLLIFRNFAWPEVAEEFACGG